MVSLDVVCVNFRSERFLVELVHALEPLPEHGVEFRVVVVDCSGMPPNIADDLKHAAVPVEVLDPGRNIGFAAAANLGAAHGTAATILFVNPDFIVDSVSLARLYEAGFAEEPPAWTGTVINLDGTIQKNAAPLPSLRRLTMEYIGGIDTRLEPCHGRREAGVLTGALLFVRRNSFEAVDGFDTGFPLYMEDVDLAVRLGHLGRLVQYPLAVGTHVGGFSASQEERCTWLLLHAARVAFFRRRGRWAGAWARLVVVLGLFLRAGVGRRWGRRALRDLVKVTAVGFDLRGLLPARKRSP